MPGIKHMSKLDYVEVSQEWEADDQKTKMYDNISLEMKQIKRNFPVSCHNFH